MLSPTDPHFEQTVRELAYYLWVCRGCKEGLSEKNWCDTQKQLRETLFDETTNSIEGATKLG